MSREQWNMNKQRSSLITILSFFMITIFLFKDIRQKYLTSLNAQTSGNVYLLRVSRSDAKKYRTVVKSNSTRLNMRQCKLCRAENRMASINSSDLSLLISVNRKYSTLARRQFTEKDLEYQLRKFVDLSATDFAQWNGSPLPHNWSNVDGDGNLSVDINFKVIMASNHRRPRVVVMPMLSSLVSPEVDVMTTSGATRGDKVSIPRGSHSFCQSQ